MSNHNFGNNKYGDAQLCIFCDQLVSIVSKSKSNHFGKYHPGFTTDDMMSVRTTNRYDFVKSIDK